MEDLFHLIEYNDIYRLLYREDDKGVKRFLNKLIEFNGPIVINIEEGQFISIDYLNSEIQMAQKNVHHPYLGMLEYYAVLKLCPKDFSIIRVTSDNYRTFYIFRVSKMVSKLVSRL